MNRRMLAAIAVAPCLAAFALGFEEMRNHYEYSLPVAGSTVWGYQLFYMTADSDHHSYVVHFRPKGSIYVTDYPMSERRGGMFTVRNVTLIDDETIRVDFADNDYTITNSKSGMSYKPVPKFSHSETIRVNQTFVAMCNNSPPSWPSRSDGDDHGTGLAILQYRGLVTHEVASVEQFLPVDRGYLPEEGEALSIHGDSVHAARWKALDPPESIPTYRFLFASASTHGEMRCDYPQVIEHTVDSKRIGPADVRDFGGTLYEWYK